MEDPETGFEHSGAQNPQTALDPKPSDYRGLDIYITYTILGGQYALKP